MSDPNSTNAAGDQEVWVYFTPLQRLKIMLLPERFLNAREVWARAHLRAIAEVKAELVQAFDTLELRVKKVSGEGKHRRVKYLRVKWGASWRFAPENAFMYRIDGYPPGLRPAKLLQPRVERDLSRILGTDVRIVESSKKHKLFVCVGNVPILSPRVEKEAKLPQKVLYSEMHYPPEGGLWLRLGIDANGNEQWSNLTAEGFPHMLMGGATGTGKSNLLNCWLVDLCTRNKPEQVRLYGIDLKRVELAPYAELPHTVEIARTARDALVLLRSLHTAIEERYGMLEEQGARKLDELEETLPRLVLVVDELAMLVMDDEYGDDCARELIKITNIGRAAGVHCILATQRPSVDSCPGALKANIPLRVSLAMATNTDSQVILDSAGAELLTPPGQAIVRRGAEMVTVMTPLLASAALDQYLARVRFGGVELTEIEKRVLQAAHKLAQEGKKISVRAIHKELGGSYNPIVAACKRLRQLGLVVGNEATLPSELLQPPLTAQVTDEIAEEAKP